LQDLTPLAHSDSSERGVGSQESVLKSVPTAPPVKTIFFPEQEICDTFSSRPIGSGEKIILAKLTEKALRKGGYPEKQIAAVQKKMAKELYNYWIYIEQEV